MSGATDNNDSVKSTPGTCMYHLTTLINFRRIIPSDSSLLLNTHLTGTGFMPLAFTMLIFVEIHAFIDRNISLHKPRKFSTNSIWTCHHFLEGISLSSVCRNRRTAIPLNFFIFVFHDWNDPGVSHYFIVTLDN